MNAVIPVIPVIGNMGSSCDRDHLSKSVGAIHIKVQSGSLGLVQKKMLNAFHFFAKDDPKKETHYVKRKDLLLMINYTSNNIEDFKENARKLRSIEVEWDYLREDKERTWGVSSLMSQIEYVTNGIIAFSFPPRIREFMATQETRGLISMQAQKLFTKGYALSLYENTTIYREKGSTPKFSIAELKALLVVNEVENSTYKEFKYFNNKVIIPSIKEVNALSDILIEAVYYKNGRTVEFISFNVALKPQSFLDFDTAPNITSVHDRLVAFGCNSTKALEIIEKHEMEYILGNLDYVESQLLIPGCKVRNPMGFFMDALQKDYRTKEPDVVRKAREKRDAEAKQKIEAERLKLEEKNRIAEENRLKKDSIRTRYEMLPNGEKIDMQESFYAELIKTNIAMAKKYKTGGLKSPAVSAMFFDFVAEAWAL